MNPAARAAGGFGANRLLTEKIHSKHRLQHSQSLAKIEKRSPDDGLIDHFQPESLNRPNAGRNLKKEQLTEGSVDLNVNADERVSTVFEQTD